MATTWSTKYRIYQVYKNRYIPGLFDSEQAAKDFIINYQADPETFWDDESEKRLYYHTVEVGTTDV